MSSWRHDPLTDRTVRIAAKRAERPNDFVDRQATRGCPFCAGAEAETPDEVDRVADADGRWLTRVVPNLYPIVEGDAGAHEVIIESPRHVRRFVDLTDEEAVAAVRTWGRTLARHAVDGRFAYRLLFKNEGARAGASLEHIHSQFVALPEAPDSLVAMWRRLAAEPAPWDLPLAHEHGGWRVVAPLAPRSPNETWLLPPSGAAATDLADAELAAPLAGLLGRVLPEIAPTAANVVLQVPPAAAEASVANRWWVEAVPRSASVAGFELSTGLWINPVAPEEAAAWLADRLSG